MEIEVKQREIETIIENKVDIGFIKRKSKANSFLGELMGDLTRARNDGNLNMVTYIEEKLKSFKKFHTSARVEIQSWKGKSGIKVLVKPDSFDLIRYRKKDQEAKPKEIIKEITKEEVNLIIKALNMLRNTPRIDEGIKTKEIAKEYCKLVNLTLNGHNRPLFEGDEFIWDNFFSDRQLHTFLNDILDLLDYYKIIKYRAGRSWVLKEIPDIQLILK